LLISFSDFDCLPGISLFVILCGFSVLRDLCVQSFDAKIAEDAKDARKLFASQPEAQAGAEVGAQRGISHHFLIVLVQGVTKVGVSRQA